MRPLESTSRLIPAFVFLLCCAGQRCDAAVQSPPALPSQTAYEQRLDDLLAARDWNALGRELSTGKTTPRDMDWLHSRVDAGGGLMLTILYARDLWVVGKQQGVGDVDKDLRITAGLISLYALEQISIDGVKCADVSAPGRRVDQVLAARRETLAFLSAEPPEVKTNIIDLALALEAHTAPLRPDDDLICRDGLEQMRASLATGRQRELPAAPGQNKTVVVTPPPGWKPSFRTVDVYRPLQEKARAGMREILVRLLQ